MRTLPIVCVLGVLGVGCVDGASSDSSASETAASACSGDRDACKIEGSQIGREGLVLQLDGGSVTFRDWVAKPGSPGEYIGFTLELDGVSSVRYVVKAGTGRFESTTTVWKHEGDDCKGISNVDFGDADPGDGGGDTPTTDDDGDGPIL